MWVAWLTYRSGAKEGRGGWRSCRRGRSRSCSPISRVRRACGSSIPEAMRPALARHDAIVRDAIEGHAGFVVKTTGDGFHAAFGTAHDAVDAAVAAQLALDEAPWDVTGPLKVRMGLHTVRGGAARRRLLRQRGEPGRSPDERGARRPGGRVGGDERTRARAVRSSWWISVSTGCAISARRNGCSRSRTPGSNGHSRPCSRSTSWRGTCRCSRTGSWAAPRRSSRSAGWWPTPRWSR